MAAPPRALVGLVLGCLLAGLLAPAARAAAAPVAVTNPGFEEPVTGGVIPGWRQTFGSTPAFTVVDTPVHSGAHSLWLVDSSTTQSSGLRSDLFAVTAGLSYQFTAAVNIQSGTPALYAYFYDASGTQLTSASAAVRGTAGTWTTGSLTMTAPAGATQAAVLLYSGVATITSAYFDDVSAGLAPGTVTDLGTPIHNVAANSAVYATAADGHEVAYLGLNGSPAIVAELDAHTGALLDQTTLPGASGVWALAVAPDGTVYAGTYSNGALYRWVPGTGAAISLGAPLPGETYTWDLTTDEQGNVYGATYPSGKVFRYNPVSTQVRDYGQLAADSQYARSIAWSQGKIYVGLGTQRAHLVELDPNSGATTEIGLPAPAASASMVYDLDAARQFLFVRTADASDLVVYDLAKQRWVADLDAAAGNGVSPPGPDNKIYYINGGTLTSYDLRTGVVQATGFTDLFSARGFGWVHLDTGDYPGNTLVSADFVGRLRLYNPMTGAHTVIESAAPTQPTTLHSTAIGPDGRVYVTGYQSGGFSVYDPATGASSQYPRGTVGQAEGMFTAFNRLWLGIYPGANLLEFDPGQPFDYGTNPSQPFSLTGDEQDRPFAFTAVGDRLAVGTVPVYGKLGGALALYQPGTDALEVHRNVVTDQSITTLTSIGETVFGGTSVYGGLGMPPSAQDGVVFAWDAASGTKLWQTTPVPGERAITALVTGPDGNLWGASVGVLFEMDPATGTVLRTKKFYDYTYSDSAQVWTSAALSFAADGSLTAELQGNLLSIDPATLNATQLASSVSQPAFAPNGDVYFQRGTDLYVYHPQSG